MDPKHQALLVAQDKKISRLEDIVKELYNNNIKLTKNVRTLKADVQRLNNHIDSLSRGLKG